MTDTAPAPPAAILEAALYCEDLAAAEAFYAGVLGFEVVIRKPGRHVFFRVGGTILLIFDPRASELISPEAVLPVPPHGAHGPGHLCFAATEEEITGWAARLAEAGHPVESDFRWPNGARSIYFRDPSGNSLEMAERRLWEG